MPMIKIEVPDNNIIALRAFAIALGTIADNEVDSIGNDEEPVPVTHTKEQVELAQNLGLMEEKKTPAKKKVAKPKSKPKEEDKPPPQKKTPVKKKAVKAKVSDDENTEFYHETRKALMLVIKGIGSGDKVTDLMDELYGVRKLSDLDSEYYDAFLVKAKELEPDE